MAQSDQPASGARKTTLTPAPDPSFETKREIELEGELEGPKTVVGPAPIPPQYQKNLEEGAAALPPTPKEAKAPRQPAPKPQEQNPEQQLGKTIGNYQILEILGEGGMGSIFKAKHMLLGRLVALKMLHPELAQKPHLVERFFTEAQAVNTIRNPNIIDISDFGFTEDKRPYFIMELLEGHTLSQELTSAQPLSIERTLHIITQIAQALEASHQAGIIHRDLKPENIFLIQLGSDNNFVKVLDFGIAKLQESAKRSTHKTEHGAVLGTPAYMSPEQAKGEEVDHRCDLYSLGVIFYELLTGQLPFDGPNGNIILAKLLTEPAPSVRAKNPEVPEVLEEAVLRLLAKDPKERFQSASEVLLALRDAITYSGVRRPLLREAAPSKDNTPRRGVTTLSGSAAQVAPKPRPAPSFVWAGGAAAGLVALLLFFLWPSAEVSPAPSPAKPPAPASTSAPGVVQPAPATKLHLKISSTPGGATVSLGDRILGKTPLDVTLETFSSPQKASISLPGYQTQEKTIGTETNQSFDIALLPVPNKKEATKPKKTTNKADDKPFDQKTLKVDFDD